MTTGGFNAGAGGDDSDFSTDEFSDHSVDREPKSVLLPKKSLKNP